MSMRALLLATLIALVPVGEAMTQDRMTEIPADIMFADPREP